jgi:alpha-L-fucosidase 2
MELLCHSTRDNLFDVCGMKKNSPYQIDGNLGAPAGMAEMLLQSHCGIVRFLPALPSAWPGGQFTGLRARGGLTVDLVWRNGKAQKATLHAALNYNHRLAVPGGQKISLIFNKGRKVEFQFSGKDEYKLKVKSGESYEVHFV